ncbi:MAG: hypothetical protein AB1746_03745 [Candidatus Zixiibacteriota bacterium]
MRHYKALLALLGVVLLFTITCDDNSVDDDNSTPKPPTGVFGFPISVSDSVELAFMWIPPTASDIDGYNQYLKIADGDFTKINDALIVGRMGIPGNRVLSESNNVVPIVLDPSSSELHTYYMTSVKGNLESSPSNYVRFTPSLIDPENSFDVYEPLMHDADVGSLPTFRWAQVEAHESYVISLYKFDDTSGSGWMFRLDDTTCGYRSANGMTYINNLGDSLNHCTTYDYNLIALDETNFYLASASESFATICGISLAGQYHGRYTVIHNYQSEVDMTIDWQYIDWTFTNQKFFCEADTAGQPEFTCDFSGNYILENVITLLDTLIAPGDCDHTDIPVGEFTISFYPTYSNPDSLVLQQLLDSTMKKIVIISDDN